MWRLCWSEASLEVNHDRWTGLGLGAGWASRAEAGQKGAIARVIGRLGSQEI